MNLPVPVMPVVQSPGQGEIATLTDEEVSFLNQFGPYFDLLLALAHRSPASVAPLHDVRLASLCRFNVCPVSLTLLSVMLECIRTGQQIPSWTALEARVTHKITALDPRIEPLIKPTIERLANLQIDPLRDVGVVLKFSGWIRRELEVRPAAARTMAEMVSGRQTMSQATETLMKLRAKESPLRTSSNPFDFSGAFAGDAMTTGLPWFDASLGGVGLLRGSGYSCIACTGGGKTTLAYTLAFSMARLGRKILIITTEQTFKERYLVNRLWSCATQIPFDRFMAYKGNGDPPDDLVNAEQKQQVAKLLENIHFYDFASLPGTLEEIDNLAENHKPDVIILDWAGTLARQLLDNGKYDDLHIATGAVAEYMRNAATRHGCATFTLHQIAGAKGTNPFGTYDHTHAQDCKTFSYNMAYALVMTPPDANKVFTMQATKSRYGVGEKVFLRIDPSVTRIVPVEGRLRKGRGGMWQADDPGTIPKSMRPKTASTGGFGAT